MFDSDYGMFLYYDNTVRVIIDTGFWMFASVNFVRKESKLSNLTRHLVFQIFRKIETFKITLAILGKKTNPV